MKRLLIFLIMGLFLISFVSAFDFDNKKEFRRDKGKFGTIEIYDSILFLIKGEKIAEHKLLENWNSLHYGYAQGMTIMYQEDVLMEKVNLYNKLKKTGIETKLKKWNFSFYKAENQTFLEPVETEVCENIYYSNLTFRNQCHTEISGYQNVTREVKVEIDYKLGQKVDPGLYYWEIEGQRSWQSTGIVDWTFEGLGFETTEWATWWNFSLMKRRTINGTNAEFIMSVNRSGNLGGLTDIDSNGNYENIYAVPGTENYVYYDDDTDVRNANDTTEFCYYNSADNVSRCPNPPTGMKGYFPFDNDWQGTGDLSDDITTVWSSTTGFGHNAGTVNNSYQASTTNNAGQGKHYEITDNADVDFGTGEFAIVFDVYVPTSETGAVWFWTKSPWYIYTDGNQFRVYDGTGHVLDSGVDANDDKWRCLVLQKDSSNNLTIWLNGTNYDSDPSFTTDLSNAADVILNYNNGGRNGVMDDLYVFKGRSFSQAEIQDICFDKYDTFLGVEETSTLLVVNANAPTNNEYFTTSSVNFNCSATDPTGVLNVSLWINGTNYENLTGPGTTNLTLTSTETLADNYYQYYCNANSAIESSNSSVLNFYVDTTFPQIVIETPAALTAYGTSNITLDLNWTVTDNDLDTCWYEYKFVNNTVTCNANTTTINQENPNQNNVTFWANDTAGNTNSSYRQWDYKLFEFNQTFQATATEGDITDFQAYVAIGGGLSVTGATLNYGSVTEVANVDTAGIYTVLEVPDFVIPSVTTEQNVSFNWSVLLSDATIVNLTTYNQTINNLDIDNCSTFNNSLLNFTVVDEETQVQLPRFIIETFIQVYSSDRSRLLINFSEQQNTTTTARYCLENSLAVGDLYSLDTVVKYEAENYSIEYYNIVDGSLDANFSQAITLYDLKTEDATEFQLTFSGTDFLPEEDVLVYVERQYISEGVFKTVELPLTDSNGQTVLHLVRNDIIYNFRMIKDGVVLATFSTVRAFCDDITIGDCKLTLNALTGAGGVFNYNDEIGLISNTDILFNETTRIVTYSFTTTDGTAKAVNIRVERNDIFGNVSLCNDTIISSSATLSCTIPAGIDDTSIQTVVSVSGTQSIFKSFDLRDLGFADWGYVVWLVLSLVMMLNYGESKTVFLIITGATVIFGISLGLSAGTIGGVGAAGIGILAVVIAGLWKINKERQQ